MGIPSVGGVTAKMGKDKILMFRELVTTPEEEAKRLALQTEHTWNYSRTTDLTQTKDGAVASIGGLEVTLEIAAVSSNDEVNTLLFNAVKQGKKLEVWEVDLLSKHDATAADVSAGYAETTGVSLYDTKYAQGYLESWDLPSSAEAIEEFSTSMNIDFKPLKGKTELSETQVNELEAAYTFKDITAVPAGG